MRLVLVLAAGLAVAAPAAGQQPTPTSAPDAAAPAQVSSPATQASSAADEAAAASGGPAQLPVSLDRIREGLERPAAADQLRKALDRQPDFRVEIRERQRIEQLLETLDFKSGPAPAGGLYYNEMQRLMFPPTDNPLAQPYAAFGPGELLTILIENLAGKYLADKAVGSITKAQRERAEAQARQEVEAAVEEYCASKPDHGAGIQICMPVPAPDNIR